MIALILIVISDSSIGLSSIFDSNLLLVNVACLITWPAYIIGCTLLNYNYTLKTYALHERSFV